MKQLIGPFNQILTLNNLPLKGALSDDQMQIVIDGGIMVEEGRIKKIDAFHKLQSEADQITKVDGDYVAMPGFIDSHTHMCWGGHRAEDYALRTSGATYQDILNRGGGIHETVRKTTVATDENLKKTLTGRIDRHISDGITTTEIKSGYGLSVEQELRILRLINETKTISAIDLVPTCLAAHVCPAKFADKKAFLDYLISDLFPILKAEKLTNRIDIFTEEGAFDVDISRHYLSSAKQMGFDVTVHADQFSTGGAKLAAEIGAVSADHLESTTDEQIEFLAKSDTVATVLPGASLGLGMQYAPARKLLDANTCVAISTDWNPGSAPMGDLLLQACVMGAAEKLSTAEVLAGITYRAARALRLDDVGILKPGCKADFIAFKVADFREIFWHQGKLKPTLVWKNGNELIGN
ncbi:MAG: imidazolonepropionase [Cyclobacteriaceae bacterium]